MEFAHRQLLPTFGLFKQTDLDFQISTPKAKTLIIFRLTNDNNANILHIETH